MRKTVWMLIGLLLLVLVVILTACNRQAATTAGQDCPQPEAGNQLLTNETNGYCLVYPEGYVVEGEADSMMISPAPGRQGMAPQPPFMTINVVPTQGMTAAAMADQLEQGMPDFDMVRTELTVGGESAIQLDRVPGQDINRQVMFTNGDQLFVLTFTPADPAAGDVYTQMEALYTTAIRSFRFIPQS
jgi:hypothetical protein